jgi:hypothetical protein
LQLLHPRNKNIFFCQGRKAHGKHMVDRRSTSYRSWRVTVFGFSSSGN